eukprot:6916977-Karenia_brevis.AAC.1
MVRVCGISPLGAHLLQDYKWWAPYSFSVLSAGGAKRAWDKETMSAILGPEESIELPGPATLGSGHSSSGNRAPKLPAGMVH